MIYWNFIKKNITTKGHNIKNSSQGYTFIELLVTMALAFIISFIGVVNFKELIDPLKNDTASLKSFVGKIRLKAMAHTAAIKIKNVDQNTINIYQARNCQSSSWTQDTSEIFKLSDTVTFTGDDFSICFNSRGFPSDVASISLIDDKGRTSTQNLMLGGAFYEEE